MNSCLDESNRRISTMILLNAHFHTRHPPYEILLSDIEGRSILEGTNHCPYSRSCQWRYSGLDLNWPVIIFMAQDSPLANAMFALAASSATNILIRYDSYELFCSVRKFLEGHYLLFKLKGKSVRNIVVSGENVLYLYVV